MKKSVLLLLLPALAGADIVFYHGKVTLEDGSPPPRSASLQRVCMGRENPIHETVTSRKTGEYFLRMETDSFGQVSSAIDANRIMPCFLEADLSGFVSSRIDLSDRHVTQNPRLPAIVLTPRSKFKAAETLPERAPRPASRFWEQALTKISTRDWSAAQTALRSAVKASPQFAAGWAALGSICANLDQKDEARQDLQRAIELDPAPLQPYATLASVLIDLHEWKPAAEVALRLIDADSHHRYLEGQLFHAIALYQLNDLDAALTRIKEAIRLDSQHELAHAEYVLGAILEGRREFDAAGQHYRNYLLQHPGSNDSALIRTRLAGLGKVPAPATLGGLETQAQPVGEAVVPGGIRAFATIARLDGALTFDNFFLEYCRSIAAGGLGDINRTRDSGNAVRAFVSTIAELESMGEVRPNATLVRMSLDNEQQVRHTQAVLAAFGWKLTPQGKTFTMEPGDMPNDAFRQCAMQALGIDELSLRSALDSRRPFEFTIPTETARLVGGAAWGLTIKGVPDAPRGPAELFIRDWRFARVYSVLGAMDTDSATALVGAIGLPALIVRYSTQMTSYGDAITVRNRQLVPPGGEQANAAWARLVGNEPKNSAPFLRSLFEKDNGRLLAFFSDLAHADAAHQHYFTQTPERAEAYYRWYRDSSGKWPADILQHLPLNAAGSPELPGGAKIWTSDNQVADAAVIRCLHPEALAAAILLETRRGQPLSPAAAQLLAGNYDQWSSLFPYFEKLPGLEAPEFEALAGFARKATAAPLERRNVLLGEWHSLVALLTLGSQAGSLDAARGAQLFRQICASLSAEHLTPAALEALHAIAGDAANDSENLDDAIARLLKLNGPRRQEFESVRSLQMAPRLATLHPASSDEAMLAALSGLVYAALLNPNELLIAEDPHLLSRHRFAVPSTLFAPTSLRISNLSPGTTFEGGFADFGKASRHLSERVAGALVEAPEASEGPAATGSASETDGATAPTPGILFHAGGRLVEVYATVTDSRGRYIDDLSGSQFSILEDGRPKQIFAFEDRSSPVSVAMVFDTTGSMADALPPLKRAAMQLVDELRAQDSVAVYSFNDRVTELQGFTSDKDAAKRAVLKTRADGITALYDALIRVNRDLSARTGKKVIIVFTDGSDNASMLNADIAIDRAKARGIPIYTIAEGQALVKSDLLAQLANMSQSTGGTAFQIRKLSDIGVVFAKMSEDMKHGYLIAFQPDAGDNHVWRKIDVVANGPKGLKVRAREGYFIE